MLNNTLEQSSDWRKNWFVVNLLAEIPILGSFFKHKTLAARLQGAAKCSAALAASTVSMHLVTDHMSVEQSVKSTGCMALSMMIGNVAYNAGTMLFQYIRTKECQENNNPTLNDPEAARLKVDTPVNSIY
jgi:hypothetical protein